jgi:hypothetical protein
VALSFFNPNADAFLNIYHIDHDMLFLVGQSRYVVSQASTLSTTNFTLSCAVTGDMLPPPPLRVSLIGIAERGKRFQPTSDGAAAIRQGPGSEPGHPTGYASPDRTGV